MAQMFTIENKLAVNLDNISSINASMQKTYGHIILKDGTIIETDIDNCRDLINHFHNKNIQHKKDCGIDSMQTI